MKINDLKEITQYEISLQPDLNDREVRIYRLENCQFSGSNLHYPNVVSRSENFVYCPIEERTMSLTGVEVTNNFVFDESKKSYNDPVFFFIYNTDNYYHFVYDTLPYLISFFKLKETYKDIKLLMNYPYGKNDQYKFVYEFLEILGIKSEDIVLIDKHTTYRKVFLSSSYTHGHDSNAPPRKEIFDFFDKIKELALHDYQPKVKLPEKFYISRRAWVHGDTSNIGTNYTSRRCLENENELVEKLVSQDFEEIFTETMTTRDKIALFAQAKVIIGAIGGGTCNVIFSSRSTKLFCLVSPNFLTINSRFKFCLDNIQTSYYENCNHVEKSYLKKFMRAKVPNLKIVGEITAVYDDSVEISYSKSNVAGWNASIAFDTLITKSSDVIPVDPGLNCAWTFVIEDFLNVLKNAS